MAAGTGSLELNLLLLLLVRMRLLLLVLGRLLSLLLHLRVVLLLVRVHSLPEIISLHRARSKEASREFLHLFPSQRLGGTRRVLRLQQDLQLR